MDKTNPVTYLHLFAILITLKHISTEPITFPARCPIPNYPLHGGYVPHQDSYLPGDTIHYFCENYYHIAGNDFRICLESGHWSGYTAICDFPAVFSETSQTSTAEPVDKNEADLANDGSRATCTSTESDEGTEWIGKFSEISRVPRIKLFLPKGYVWYEVFVVRPDGSEFSCGERRAFIERYEWSPFHYCPEPNDTNMQWLKIKSKSPNIPLRLCEVDAHAIPDPWCHEPFFFVDNGRLLITRKSATLKCDPGFKRSRDTQLDCVNVQVWDNKTLYCYTTEREVEAIPKNYVIE